VSDIPHRPDGPRGRTNGGEAGPRPGLPWERRDELGAARGLARTVIGILTSPTGTYQAMRRGGGWAEPLVYAIVVGSLGAWAAEIWQMLGRSFLAATTGVGAQEVATANVRAVIVAVLTPGLIAVFTVVGAGINHLLLLIVGAEPRGYETTLRVNSYAISAQVFGVVPLCGFLIALVWGVVVQIIGLREAHEVSTGQAATAVLVPLIVSCVCAALFFLAILGVASMAGGIPS